MLGASRLSLAGVWLAALLISYVVIISLLSLAKDTICFPESSLYGTSTGSIFIGSSLTYAALPDEDVFADLPGSASIAKPLTLPGITAAETFDLMAWALDSGHGDLMVELNAFTTQYQDSPIDTSRLPELYNLAEMQVVMGQKLTWVVKQLVGLANPPASRIVGTSRITKDIATESDIGHLLRLAPQSFFFSDRLHSLMRMADEQGRRVLFYWPPVPDHGAGSHMPSWNAARSHIIRFCEQHRLRCWLPDAPWDKRFFMDARGHLAQSGRIRFTASISDWVAAL